MHCTALLLHAADSAAQDSSTPVRIVNTPLAVTVTSPGAGSGFLGTTKPSDLVTIRPSGATCAPSPWLMLGARVNGDGTLTPFVALEGRVLVVTSVDCRPGATGAAGKQEAFFLYASAANIAVTCAIVDLINWRGIRQQDGDAWRRLPA